MKIRIEPYIQCWKDIEHLLPLVYDETLGPQTGKKLFYARQTRLQMAAKGEFVIAVVRDDEDKAVGFCSFSLRYSWYDGRAYASEDALFLLPEYRKGNTFNSLWECAEGECIRRGAKEVQFIAPQTIIGRLKLWFRKGYKQTGVVLTKRI